MISGPSGVGKSTAISKMRNHNPELCFSVSATTRAPRAGDADGVTYRFKSREEFEAMIHDGEFYEYAQYAGNYYGTPKAPVEQQLAGGRDVILDIEVQGALQIRKCCRDAVLVFLVAPSFSVLEQRLRGRGDTSEDAMQKRLDQAKWEYTQAAEYDYIVVSDTPERTVEDLESILRAESLRSAQQLDLL